MYEALHMILLLFEISREPRVLFNLILLAKDHITCICFEYFYFDQYNDVVDGAIFPLEQEAGVGVIIRDDQGLVIAALIKKIKQPLGPLVIEAKAFEEGILFARDIGIQEFELEEDSLMVVNALAGSSYPLSLMAAVIYGITSLSHEFRGFEVSHICRNDNELAHFFKQNMLQMMDIEHYITWIEENFYLLKHLS